jgi:hypothetical protein
MKDKAGVELSARLGPPRDTVDLYHEVGVAPGYPMDDLLKKVGEVANKVVT